MNPKLKKPILTFVAVVGVFPLTGSICALFYRNIEMFYYSPFLAGVAAFIFPLAFLAVHVLCGCAGGLVVGLILGIQRMFKRK